MSVGIVGARIKHARLVTMFKGGTQGDGLHYSAVTLVSPIAEVNGEGFKFHREEVGAKLRRSKIQEPREKSTTDEIQ
jgi:hypothetical protein